MSPAEDNIGEWNIFILQRAYANPGQKCIRTSAVEACKIYSNS
jgi:hypothetical protein